MNAERWQRVREVFDAADDLDGAERADYLAEACEGDAELRREVESLLGADTDSERGRRLAAGAPAELVQSVRAPLVGARIAGFRILRVIGSGGMGTVYAAEQDHPRREVAIKTLHVGLRDPGLRRRFEYEAEVLGRLRHPGIAQVHSAGTCRDEATGEAIPYFAMEYVDGARPLDRHVEEQAPGTAELLELFLMVCAAVQHGHQKGIIHRDLKPANVLVDGAGQPKVIDFGISCATEAAGATMHTATGHVLGTLQYMSPEQLDGSDEIDVRSDVYALGVMLYVLLTGRPPVDLSGKSITAAAQALKEARPPRPSEVGQRGTGRLPRELDWVVLQAMDPDRERRYATVSELAADLRRFLADEPVAAGPPSAAYRLRTFVRRNRALVGGVAAVFVALVLGVAAATWQMFEARTMGAAARHQARRAEAVNEFLNDVLAWGDPIEKLGGGAEFTMREALARAAAGVDELAAQPLVEADVRMTLSNAFRGLAEPDAALEHGQRALELRRAWLPAGDPEIGTALNAVALARAARGEDAEAERLHREALAIVERTPSSDHPELGSLMRINVARMLGERGERDQAEQMLRRSLAELRALDGDYVRFEAMVLDKIAGLLGEGGRDGYEEVMGEALAAYERAGKRRHPYAATARWNLGMFLWDQARHAEAEPLLLEALEIKVESLGEDHPDTILLMSELGRILKLHGELERAEPFLLRAVAAREQRYGPDDRTTALERFRLGTLYSRQGDFVRAEDHLRRAHAAMVQSLGLEDRDSIVTLNDLVYCLRHLSKLDEADGLARQALELAERTFEEGDSQRLTAIRNLAEVARLRGSTDEAVELHTRLLDFHRDRAGEGDDQAISARNNVAVTLATAGRWSEAEVHLRRCVELHQQNGDPPESYLITRNNLALSLEKQDRLDESVRLYRAALETARAASSVDEVMRAVLRKGYGVCLTKMGEHAAAETELLESLAVVEPRFGSKARRTQKLYEALVDLYESWDKQEEAARYRAKLEAGR